MSKRCCNLCFNPQEIYHKDLSGTTLGSGVKIIGDEVMNKIDLFEGVKIKNTNFNGCKNVRINPQTIHNKSLTNSNLEGVNFSGYSFDGCEIWQTNFRGSVGAEINPNTVKNMVFATLLDVKILDLAEDGLNNNLIRATNYYDLIKERDKITLELTKQIKDQLPVKEENIEPLKPEQEKEENLEQLNRKLKRKALFFKKINRD